MIDRGPLIFVIKKNFIILFVQLILLAPAISMFPFLITMLFYGYLIALIPAIICLGFVAIGLHKLNMFIKFGNKRLVIYEKGLEFAKRSIQFIEWKNVKNVSIQYMLSVENLILTLNSGKQIEINLIDTSLAISSDEIYEMILEKWTQDVEE